jgi:hypothetical protein
MGESTSLPHGTTPGAGPATAAAAGGGLRQRAVEELLLDRWDQGALRRARQAGHDARLPHGVLVAAGTELDEAHATVRAVAGQVARASVLRVPAAVPPHAALVVPVPVPPIWAHALSVARQEASQRGVTVALHPPVTGLRALRAAYQRALSDASLALAAGPGNALVSPEDVVVPRMLALLDAAGQQALTSPIRPLLTLSAANRDAYLRTLEVLRRTGGVLARAAVELHLHVNSVRYRIDRIEEMTGLRLSDPSNRLAIDLAVMLVRLRSTPERRSTDYNLGWLDHDLELAWDRPILWDTRVRRARPVRRRPRPGEYVARLVPLAAA